MFTIDPNASDYCRDIITYQEIQSYPRTLLWNKSTDCCSWNGVHCDEMTGSIIPYEISHLSKLHVLHIWNTSSSLYGPYNFELLLKNLTQLRELNLHYVDISSTIPSNFSSHLTTLQLSDTLIRGIFPERVFHISNLESLDLSENPQLTVRFPTTKWNSSASLMYLYLGHVNITGRIPESFSHLTSLYNLDMSDFNLSGPIPKPLWNLTNIEFLDLGNNHLEGPISQLSRFEKLKVFTLKNNNFDGQLECLSFNRSWTQLVMLDFRSNSLTGQIPSNVTGLQNLQSVYLSSNNLNGTIPSWIFSLPSLTFLENSSYQGNGGLCGLPLSKHCGGDGRVPQVTILVELDQEEDSPMISWQAVLMGYGCGLVIGLSVIYIMLST
ncbi:hypothetical protein KY289_000154 [Solanum tuberosum]|nr:hypothetical protein KY289_000154 [Solanum tuberosum]